MARPLRIDLAGRNSLLWVAISIVPRIIVNAFAPEKVNGKLTGDSGFLNGEPRDDVCDKIEFWFEFNKEMAHFMFDLMRVVRIIERNRAFLQEPGV